MEDKKKLATLVGCNYPNTRFKLDGCINDANAMRDLLIQRFGFKSEDVKVLIDAPDSCELPTGSNIMRALSRMVAKADPGDILFFHFSGHGILIPGLQPYHDPSYMDEAIVPCDLNLITDVDFRQLVDRLPAKATLTILSDCCHSGGLIDKEKEQIGPSTNVVAVKTAASSGKRAVSLDTVLDHLSTLSNMEASHVSGHLRELFGNEASAKFTGDAPVLVNPCPVLNDDGILLSGCQMNETSEDASVLVNPCPVLNDDGILLSGCQMNETSEDASGGIHFGAFTNAMLKVMKEHVGAISNRELVMRTRELWHVRGIKQHPCLYSIDHNADAPFLHQSEGTSI